MRFYLHVDDLILLHLLSLRLTPPFLLSSPLLLSPLLSPSSSLKNWGCIDTVWPSGKEPALSGGKLAALPTDNESCGADNEVAKQCKNGSLGQDAGDGDGQSDEDRR